MTKKNTSPPETELLRASLSSLAKLAGIHDPAPAHEIERAVVGEFDKLKAENERLLEKIDEWKDATGLIDSSGDPGGIEPRHLRDEVSELLGIKGEVEGMARLLARENSLHLAWKKAAEAWVFVADNSKVIFTRGDGSPSDLALDALEVARTLEQESGKESGRASCKECGVVLRALKRLGTGWYECDCKPREGEME